MSLVAVAALLAVPALVMRITCLGRACEDEGTARASNVPFCSLPSGLRHDIASGYREGRSPEVLAAATGNVVGATGFGTRRGPSWPGTDLDTRVPLYFAGTGVGSMEIPEGTTLDAVAPTLSEIIGLERPHPEVRSGTPIEGVATGERPRLVLLVVASGLGSRDIEAGRASFFEDELIGGAVTMEADPGSQPLDPAAVLTTIGTGGLPRQHGVTGRMIRNDEGRLVQAWSDAAPVSVIATLADDLDETTNQRAKIGVSMSHRSDRGIVGGNWYVGGDRDRLLLTRGAGEDRLDLSELARGGYGKDPVTDLFALIVKGGVGRIREAFIQSRAVAERVSDGSYTVVFTGTGSRSQAGAEVGAQSIATRVDQAVGADVVEGLAAGGLFLDVNVQTEEKISEDRVIEAMRDLRGADGSPVFADVFPALAVSFARYC